ncbi:unnamed protein product [Amoebophrya sp. A25]|nr:unnamed protein product [Amoebophrya sp. A25]|eukprot:GSA25T00013362001.1
MSTAAATSSASSALSKLYYTFLASTEEPTDRTADVASCSNQTRAAPRASAPTPPRGGVREIIPSGRQAQAQVGSAGLSAKSVCSPYVIETTTDQIPRNQMQIEIQQNNLLSATTVEPVMAVKEGGSHAAVDAKARSRMLFEPFLFGRSEKAPSMSNAGRSKKVSGQGTRVLLVADSENARSTSSDRAGTGTLENINIALADISLVTFFETGIHTCGYIGMIIIGKILFEQNMPYPLFLIFTDQIVCSAAIAAIRGVGRADACVIDPREQSQSQRTDAGNESDVNPEQNTAAVGPYGSFASCVDAVYQFGRNSLGDFDFLSELVPLSILNVGTGACGIAANLFLFPSFTEAIQMTGPVIQVPLGYVFQRTTVSTLALLALVPLSLGGILSAVGEINFHKFGIMLAMGSLFFRAGRMLYTSVIVVNHQKKEKQAASVCVVGNALEEGDGTMSGTRFTLSVEAQADGNDYLRQSSTSSTAANSANEKKPIALNLARAAMPLNAAVLLTASFLIEGAAPWRAFLWGIGMRERALILVKGMSAACWYVTEFILIEEKGAVFTSIVANMNRVGAIGTGLLVFRNPVSAIQAGGFALTFTGLGLYFKSAADESRTQHAGEEENANRAADSAGTEFTRRGIPQRSVVTGDVTAERHTSDVRLTEVDHDSTDNPVIVPIVHQHGTSEDEEQRRLPPQEAAGKHGDHNAQAGVEVDVDRRVAALEQRMGAIEQAQENRRSQRENDASSSAAGGGPAL